MKLEQCLAALKALPQDASHFEMPFRLVSDFEQTEELLEATKKEFWELLKSKGISKVNVFIIGKMIVFPMELEVLVQQFEETSVRDVKFILDGQYAKQNNEFARAALKAIVQKQPHVWTFGIRNLTLIKAESTLAKLNVRQPLEYADILLRPYFGSEPGALNKATYQQKLVELLTKVKPNYIALRLNVDNGPLVEDEVHECFALLAKAGCYKVDLNFKNLPLEAEKLMTTIAHKMMIAKDSPWMICAIKKDHVAKFQKQLKENRLNKKKVTSQRKQYRESVKASVQRGFFAPSFSSKLKVQEVQKVALPEPNLVDFFTTYFH